jgi:hypothetical protein
MDKLIMNKKLWQMFVKHWEKKGNRDPIIRAEHLIEKGYFHELFFNEQLEWFEAMKWKGRDIDPLFSQEERTAFHLVECAGKTASEIKKYCEENTEDN